MLSIATFVFLGDNREIVKSLCGGKFRCEAERKGIQVGKYLTNNELDSELIIGLVGAVGTETRPIIDLLQEQLGRVGYRVEVVKVSADVIPLLCDVEDPGNDRFKRYSDLMDAGNRCREMGVNESPADDAVLALGVATYIAARRSQLNRPLVGEADDDAKEREEGKGEPLARTAFIIDSLKRPEEVEKLRIIYSSGFVLLGIHAEVGRRRSHLVENLDMTLDQADQLIERDRQEGDKKHGQRVNATFHLADFFVQVADNSDRLRCDIRRLVGLWFGDPFFTPTFDEYAMFMAFAAALRSADLSRQVGAVMTRDSEILSTGANECPSPEGGLYWAKRNPKTGCIEDVERGRDYKRDGDSNRLEQLKIIERIITEAMEEKEDFDGDTLRTVLKESGIRDLTEFGRVVHAEMEAILSCGRNGISTKGATLHCTTFPCHNCAKHIVAAGVKRVVYVEPYSKSKALEFHDDSIVPAENAQGVDGEKVLFEPFVGVGPRKYFELFSMNLGSSYPLVRKNPDTGAKKEWRIEAAQLRLQMKPVSYLEIELLACKAFSQKMALRTNGDVQS
ncbi:anti-phage dCTP deaminase [Lignipirellula cremea]|uniref:tRNA-specific adenosine deaminase n=1 Tax=Lignipirellula cremea TaxID=2528010 RepID=A0A518E315_9BACT|nr:anti-phage dCTP deaminase [Lignipirellula cremea]QDU98478.1 tRNA-specific adenosine deaminase [Lignipirellula cremea]